MFNRKRRNSDVSSIRLKRKKKKKKKKGKKLDSIDEDDSDVEESKKTKNKKKKSKKKKKSTKTYLFLPNFISKSNSKSKTTKEPTQSIQADSVKSRSKISKKSKSKKSEPVEEVVPEPVVVVEPTPEIEEPVVEPKEETEVPEPVEETEKPSSELPVETEENKEPSLDLSKIPEIDEFQPIDIETQKIHVHFHGGSFLPDCANISKMIVNITDWNDQIFPPSHEFIGVPDSPIFDPAFDYDFFIKTNLENQGLYLHILLLGLDDSPSSDGTLGSSIIGMTYINIFVDEDGLEEVDEDTVVIFLTPSTLF